VASRGSSGPIRVGFVGAGRLATHVHYPSLDELDNATLVAITDIDQPRLLATADRYNIRGRYSNHRDMLDKEDLDAVYVVMPPHLLHDIVIDCLEAGKHVLLRSRRARPRIRQKPLPGMPPSMAASR
jgi:virulence factor